MRRLLLSLSADARSSGDAAVCKGLAPLNWTNAPSPLPHGWKGGFLPPPRSIYPAIRDAKAAIRWLRGQSDAAAPVLQGSVLAAEYVGAGGWSAGACTTAFLASQRAGDFTDEMDARTDPTYGTMVRTHVAAVVVVVGLLLVVVVAVVVLLFCCPSWWWWWWWW